MTPTDFVKTYYPFALQTEKKTGISGRFILAQAALESDWGKSIPGNMFFGVKANPKTTPENKRQLVRTTEVLKDANQGYKFPVLISVTKRPDGKYLYVVKDWFRKYDTPEECFTDYSKFFFSNIRYTKALQVKGDPYKFATEVAKAGYATATNYEKTLHDMIKSIDKALSNIK